MPRKGGVPANLREPWRKGQSGNPKGSSHLVRERKQWRDWLEELEPDAQAVIEQLLRDKRVSLPTRHKVALDVLDRLHGRPTHGEANTNGEALLIRVNYDPNIIP